MRRTSITTLIAIMAIGLVQAQWSIGARVGATGSSMQSAEIIEMITPDFRMLPGFEAGLSANYSFSDRFSLTGEISYTHAGFRVKEQLDMGILGMNLPLGVQVDTRIGNVRIPLLAQLQVGKGPVTAFVGVGPEVSYATHARVRAKSDFLLDLEILDRPLSLDAINYKRFDIGAMGTIGVAYKTQIGEFFMDGRFRHGFGDLVQVPVVDTNVKNIGAGFGVGFRAAI